MLKVPKIPKSSSSCVPAALVSDLLSEVKQEASSSSSSSSALLLLSSEAPTELGAPAPERRRSSLACSEATDDTRRSSEASNVSTRMAFQANPTAADQDAGLQYRLQGTFTR